jgi:hypothetical protein
MNLDYKQKEDVMKLILAQWQSPAGFRSSYKGVPMDGNYDNLKQFIDFTKYYVMFRGPRNRGASSTRKRHAKAFDVYMRSARDTDRLRIEREAFLRDIQWARSH